MRQKVLQSTAAIFLTLASVSAFALSSCVEGGKPPAQECEQTSDCAPRRLCVVNTCRDICTEAADCGQAESCEPQSSELSACVPADITRGPDGGAPGTGGNVSEDELSCDDGYLIREVLTSSMGGMGGLGGAMSFDPMRFECVKDTCGVNEYVEDKACLTCPGVTSNDAGDWKWGDDVGVSQCEDSCSDYFGVDCSKFQADGYIKAYDNDDGIQFGRSVSLYGNTLVVGANLVEPRVDVYEHDGGSPPTWKHVQTLEEPGENDTQFGVSVSIWKDRIAVGASNQDAGAVYLYQRINGEWTKIITLPAPHPNTNEKGGFGYSLALYEDELLVGAPWADDPESNLKWPGLAYVYDVTRAADEHDHWDENPEVLRSTLPEPSGTFGVSVSIHESVAVVGAHHEGGKQRGAAYAFLRSEEMWRAFRIVPQENTGWDRFGYSVSAWGKDFAIGSVQENGGLGGIFTQESTVNGIGSAGAVYVFRAKEGSELGWEQEVYIKPEEPDVGDRFGYSVSFRGNRLAVGAPFEDSGATNAHGDSTDGSVLNSGAAFLFEVGPEGWEQKAYVKAPLVEPAPRDEEGALLDSSDHNNDEQDSFGNSLCLQQDGTNDSIAIGALKDNGGGAGPNTDEANRTKVNSGAVYYRKLPSQNP